MEKIKRKFTQEDISKYTGYPVKGSINAKISRNEWSAFIKPIGNKVYVSEGVLNISLDEFARKISTKQRLSPYQGSKIATFKQEARDLILISKSEFLLAIELFNRPTAPNRLDAFLTHFVSAFEKLLKSKLIEDKGIESIWQNSLEKKTKSIRKILHEEYKPSNPIRMNLEYIIDLRDNSTHYLLPEMGAIASRYFQSGVLNYSKMFQNFVEEPPIKLQGIGLLSLVFEGETPSQASLKQNYGASNANEIIGMIEKFKNKASEVNDLEFAIPVNYSIGIVNNTTDPDKTLANLSSEKAIFIDKVRDPKKTHPFMVKDIVEQVNKRLINKYGSENLEEVLPTRKKHSFNSQDFIGICQNENWKNNSNRFHFDHGSQARNTYSKECIDFIIQKITSDKRYLNLVKEKRQKRNKSNKN